jgi:hypothetical protein
MDLYYWWVGFLFVCWIGLAAWVVLDDEEF